MANASVWAFGLILRRFVVGITDVSARRLAPKETLQGEEEASNPRPGTKRKKDERECGGGGGDGDGMGVVVDSPMYTRCALPLLSSSLAFFSRAGVCKRSFAVALN